SSSSLSSRRPLLFFFHSYRHHPPLHSFPTRRSSDLARRLHRLVAALGMDLIRRQALGAGDRQPMQRPPHPQSGLIHMQHLGVAQDRKSTRLNSSHVASSYAVFCLKKKRAAADTVYTV